MDDEYRIEYVPGKNAVASGLKVVPARLKRLFVHDVMTPLIVPQTGVGLAAVCHHHTPKRS